MGAFACCAAKDSELGKCDGVMLEGIERREAMPELAVTVEREAAYPRFVQITVKAWEQVNTSMLRGLNLSADDWIVGSVWVEEELIDVTREWEAAGITEDGYIVRARILKRTEPLHQTVRGASGHCPSDGRLASRFAPGDPSSSMSVLDI